MDEETLVHRAQEMPPGERAPFLEKACAGDPTLRRRVEKLLQASEEPGFLEHPAFGETEVPESNAEGAAFPAGREDQAHPATTRVGQSLGRYNLQDCLGEGGMGQAYKAYDPQMDRVVVVKLLNRSLHQSGAAYKRFHQEIKTVAALPPHPNIVTAFTADHVGEDYYLVMEYVDGKDLSKVVKAGPDGHPVG